MLTLKSILQNLSMEEINQVVASGIRGGHDTDTNSSASTMSTESTASTESTGTNTSTGS